MKSLVLPLATIVILTCTGYADARGCFKGALVGGIAGHYAGHHGIVGAAAGCVVGRHEAKKRERERMQAEQKHRELQNGEERF